MEKPEVITIEFQGYQIHFDDQGYLIDINQWSEELAEYLSKRDGLKLTQDHWEIIRFMREYYKLYQMTPMTRVIIKKLNASIHREKYNVKYLYKLFPRTPITHACKYAGIPRPTGCI